VSESPGREPAVPEPEPESGAPEPEPEPDAPALAEPAPPDAAEPATRSAPTAVGLLAGTTAGSLAILIGLTALAGQLGLGGPFAPPSASPGPSSAASPRPTGTPTAAPSPGATPSGDPVLVGAGDIGDCASDGDERTAALLDAIAGTVFTAGDHAYDDGSIGAFEACYAPSWGRHLARTRPAPGNHDYETEEAGGYRAYFGPAAAPDGATWYSYDLADWHVVVLDSNCPELEDGCGSDSPQVAWLRADLEASDATCTVAIWHHPRFSSGEAHGDDPSVGPFWDVLHEVGAEVVVNGHDHDYERFALQDPTGARDPERGIRQFVVGTGGAPLRGFGEPRPNSQVRSAFAHGVLALTLHPGSYNWRFHAVDGSVDDQGSGACRA
jgi:hypothetical protein